MYTSFPTTGFSPFAANFCGPNCSPFCVPGTDCSWGPAFNAAPWGQVPFAGSFPWNNATSWNQGWNAPAWNQNWNTPIWNQIWNQNGYQGWNQNTPFNTNWNTPFAFNRPTGFGGFNTPGFNGFGGINGFGVPSYGFNGFNTPNAGFGGFNGFATPNAGSNGFGGNVWNQFPINTWNTPFAGFPFGATPWFGFVPGFNQGVTGVTTTGKNAKKGETETPATPYGYAYPFPFAYAPFGCFNPAMFGNCETNCTAA